MADLDAYYRQRLQREFQERNTGSRSFSQNSFAKILGMTSSYYSKLMKGKILLSLDLADKISKKLKLNPEERKQFILSVADEQRCHALYLIDPHYTECDPQGDKLNKLPVRTVKSLR